MKKICLLFLFLLGASVGFAQEHISRFFARAQVSADGRVTITETITIQAHHQQIRRGIYRSVALKNYQKIQVLSLLMDGEKHPYSVEEGNGFYRINFGDEKYISLGEHTYQLVYVLSNVLGHFSKYDEIYWNVTGNEWDFLIYQARAQVILPPDTPVFENKISIYTGAKGAKEKNAARSGLDFWTTQSLRPKEGLTIAIPFEKGHVYAGPMMRWIGFWQEYKILIAWVLFALACLYTYWAWKRVGKDPVARVVRRFEPPEGLSPAMVMCIYRMGPGKRTLPIILLSLTMKGLLEMTQTEGNKWLVSKKEPPVPLPPLSTEEQLVFAQLPAVKVMDDAGDAILQKLDTSAQENLLLQCGSKYFDKNTVWLFPILATALLLALLFFWRADRFFLFFMFYSFMVLSNIKKITVISLGVVLVLGIVIYVYFAGTIANYAPQLAVLLAFTLLSVLFAKIIRAYTVRGRQIMNEIEGFRQYLSVAEGRRILSSDPTDAQKIFCDYLPYAFALGVQDKWIESFDEVLDDDKKDWAAHRGLNGNVCFAAMLRSVGNAMQGVGKSDGHSGSGGGGYSGGGFGGGGGGGR